MPDSTDMRSAVKPYERAFVFASTFQLVSSVGLFIGACVLMYWSLRLSYFLTLLLAIPTLYYTGTWFPEWWVRQMLRISLRLVHGQIGPRRVSKHTPAEVVAQGGDTERVVMLADNVIDNATSLVMVVSMTLAAMSAVWKFK